MCGIAGIISKGKTIESGRIEWMTSSLRHRGPDDLGFHHSPFAHVGMCRLSIIDLSSTGLCPLVYEGKNGQPIVVAYNGEIFNFVELRDELKARDYGFRTTCDSEVLLQAYRAWGEECLDHFNGMFAFAILDYEKDLLFAARDRAGEKPFYYYEDSEQFLFASEIKAILTQIPKSEPYLPDELEALEYIPGEQTPFRGVVSLLAGHKLFYRGIRGKYHNQTTLEYWKLLDHLRDVRPEKAVDEMDELLQDSVKIRLRSDVPLGLYLSGGLDSSLIACIAKCSVCFSCQFASGPQYDEVQYAKRVAEEIGAKHVIIQPSKKEFEENLPAMIYYLDYPVGSFSIFPLFVMAREARKHVKIVLSGEGADELFSGYTRYLIFSHEQELYKLPGLRHYRPLLDFYYGQPIDRFAKILNRGRRGHTLVKSIISKYFQQFEDPIHAMGYTDFKLMLVTLLQMEDRACAAFGLENRSPYLDHRIIEFAFSIPPEMKIRNMTSKWILRQVASRYVPKLIVERQDKLGLVAPINLWMGFRTGERGEFDREAYNRLCMEKWIDIFFNEPRLDPAKYALSEITD